MSVLHIYSEDLRIASSLIQRDETITRHYFYQQCYPLFKSIYDNYYTDCKCCKEFMDEIYVLVLAPSKITGKCQMENFKGESSLACWLKSVCLFYCYHRYKLKKRRPLFESLNFTTGNKSNEYLGNDRLDIIYGSVDLDFSNVNHCDVLVILNQMPNKRYSDLIRLRYLEHKSNEETADALGMSMANYYNKHKLAKAQFLSISRKEAHNG